MNSILKTIKIYENTKNSESVAFNTEKDIDTINRYIKKKFKRQYNTRKVEIDNRIVTYRFVTFNSAYIITAKGVRTALNIQIDKENLSKIYFIIEDCGDIQEVCFEDLFNILQMNREMNQYGERKEYDLKYSNLKMNIIETSSNYSGLSMQVSFNKGNNE